MWMQACRDEGGDYPSRIIDDAAEEAFWSQHALTYDNTQKLVDYAPHVADKIRHLLGEVHTVLEIGCGTGKFTIPLAKHFDEIIGLDLSEHMLAQLQRKLDTKNLTHVHTMRGKWEDAHIEPGKIDGIFLVNALYRMLDLRTCLRKMNETAKESVVLVWTQPRSRFEQLFRRLNMSGEGVRRDYIYLLLIMYEMGIDPSVEFMDVVKRVTYPTLDGLYQSIRAAIPERTFDEHLVSEFIDEHVTEEGEVVTLQFEQKVAFIQWKPVTHLQYV